MKTNKSKFKYINIITFTSIYFNYLLIIYKVQYYFKFLQLGINILRNNIVFNYI